MDPEDAEIPVPTDVMATSRSFFPPPREGAQASTPEGQPAASSSQDEQLAYAHEFVLKNFIADVKEKIYPAHEAAKVELENVIQRLRSLDEALHRQNEIIDSIKATFASQGEQVTQPLARQGEQVTQPLARHLEMIESVTRMTTSVIASLPDNAELTAQIISNFNATEVNIKNIARVRRRHTELFDVTDFNCVSRQVAYLSSADRNALNDLIKINFSNVDAIEVAQAHLTKVCRSQKEHLHYIAQVNRSLEQYLHVIGKKPSLSTEISPKKPSAQR
jgi:hypothetical protein